MSVHELTSPRRSSRNHASTLALDVQLGIATSVKDVEEEKKEKEQRGRKGSKDTSAPKKVTVSKEKPSPVEKKTPPSAKAAPKRKGPNPEAKKKKSKKESSVSDSESDSEDEDGGEGGRRHKKKTDPNREPTVKEVIEQRMRMRGPRGTDFSVSRLIGEAKGESPASEEGREDVNGGVPDETAIQLAPECAFANDALGRVNVPVPPGATQFSIGGVKYLPLSSLMDDEGFTVSLTEPVLYTTIEGKQQVSTLSDALKVTAIAVKRRGISKELLSMLRRAGLVVHWAFVAKLMPARLQSERESPASSEGKAKDELVRARVAELIEHRKRRSLDSTYTPRTTYAFPVREYRPRQATIASALAALASVAAAQRDAMPSSSSSLIGDVSRYSTPNAFTSVESTPLKISDPDHLSRFIGMLNGSGSNSDKEEASPSQQQTSTAHYLPDGDPAASLSLTQKILLISDYDTETNEETLAEKFGIPIDSVKSVIRFRVPLIREFTRLEMEKGRQARLRHLPVRRTNYVGLNIMMWRFFRDCRDRGIPLTGRQLKEHAMTIAAQLGLSSFRGSEGWLDAFKRRHKIDLKTMTGEAVNYEADPDGNIVCASGDEEDEYHSNEGTRENTPPLNGTETLLANATALATVVEGAPIPDPLVAATVEGMEGIEQGLGATMEGSTIGGTDTSAIGEGGEEGGQGTTAAAMPSAGTAFQLPPHLANDPRMQADYRIDESSLIATIIRSTAVHLPHPELTNAINTIRAFCVMNDPASMTFLYELQCRLQNVVFGQCSPAFLTQQQLILQQMGADNGELSTDASTATPPMLNGTATTEEKNDEEKEAKENAGAATMNGKPPLGGEEGTSSDTDSSG